MKTEGNNNTITPISRIETVETRIAREQYVRKAKAVKKPKIEGIGKYKILKNNYRIDLIFRIDDNGKEYKEFHYFRNNELVKVDTNANKAFNYIRSETHF